MEKVAADCNFVRLEEDDLNRCLSLQPNGGISVRVDLSDFATFQVLFRGQHREELTFPKWQIWRRNQVRQRWILKRVLVLARYRPERGGNVVVKLFKDVPIENIKIIAPKVEFNMPFFDRIKVGGSFLGGLAATVLKVMKLAAFTGQFFLLLLASLVVLTVKGILSFFNSRTKYLHRYSSSLYFQSLSNNGGAISSLVLMAEEQEVKETILAAYMLQIRRNSLLTADELDAAIEQWLRDSFEIDVDFEVVDAIRKLDEKKLLVLDETEEDTRYQLLSLEQSLVQLDEDWDNFYSFNAMANRPSDANSDESACCDTPEEPSDR